MKIFEEQLVILKKSTVYTEVKSTAKSDLDKWITANLEEVTLLKECRWHLDEAVFFNTKKDKAYLLLLIQDNQPHAELDYVYVMYAALEHTGWKIYFSSLPGYVFPRERFAGKKTIPFSVLSRIGRQEMLKSYYNAKGNINDQFVDKAYTPDLIAKHLKFLNKTDQ